MKRLLFLFLLFTYKGFAQYAVVSDSIKKPGIYRTFEEFRDNNPSIVVKFKVLSEDSKYGSIGNRSSITAYGLDFSAKMSENIGPVFGFCDGKDLFIVAKTVALPHYFSFYKVERVANYTVFRCAYDSLLAVTAVYWRTGGIKILNLENGAFLNLTKKNLKKIIKDNPELSARFDKEVNQEDVLEKYILEYLKK